MLNDILLGISELQFRFIDILMSIVLFYGGYRGYQKGLLVELISLVSFVFFAYVLIWLIFNGFDSTDQWVNGYNKTLPFITTMLLLFGLVLLLNWGGRMLADMIGYTIFGSFDNVLGIVFGLIKYTFAFGVLFKMLIYVGLLNHNLEMQSSVFYPYLMRFFDYTVEVMDIIGIPASEMLKDMRMLLKR
ncbi:CvpA family protein [Hugenholtzia roseola]|uniref:CvpA family protein n=1 Tax=Hugenholtzia roseola TaxID=1002 RepID=UPI000418DEF5|nr:CvpA family protein [Hugenholtzia roseola]